MLDRDGGRWANRVREVSSIYETYFTLELSDFHQFFDAKVAGVRASTVDAPSPTFTAVDPGCSFTHFEFLTVGDVAAAIRALPGKQCSSDPIATRYVKEAVDVLAPFCTELFKAVYVTPLLKKVGLDPADVSSYRPISNLSVMSKLLERLVAKQLVGYLTASGLLPRLQSAYRAHHSTETAVLKVMTDILRCPAGLSPRADAFSSAGAHRTA